MQILSDIRAILTTRTLDSFIGLKESLWFDAKRSPGYDLATPNGRIELAKDVSGFANAKGGYLVVGLETQPLVDQPTEEVSGLNLVAQTEFNARKFEGIIKEHVYPEIVGLRVDWVECATRTGQGVGVVWVPRQEESKKPFLMTRVIEDGQELKQIVFGIAKRVGSSTLPITLTSLYSLVQNGNSDTAQRLTRIENKIDSILKASDKQVDLSADRDLEAKIKKIIDS